MQKMGPLELADEGTLFLDEVGDIPIEIQTKLLRASQEWEFERLGSTHTKGKCTPGCGNPPRPGEADSRARLSQRFGAGKIFLCWCVTSHKNWREKCERAWKRFHRRQRRPLATWDWPSESAGSPRNFQSEVLNLDGERDTLILMQLRTGAPVSPLRRKGGREQWKHATPLSWTSSPRLRFLLLLVGRIAAVP